MKIGKENLKTVRPRIEPGYRCGMLTVIESTAERKNGYTVWRCRCDCGSEMLLDTRALQRGKIRDCGCDSVVRPGMVDLTGMRFGKLVCIEPADQKSQKGETLWMCRCDCGNICLTSVHQLRMGYRKSCGCLSHPPLKEYIGKQFGKLTVVAYAGKTDGMHRWKCICECGNETVVRQTMLQNGATKSCGCLKAVQLRENLNLIDGTSITMISKNRNRKPIASNKSGYNGVYKVQKTGKWAAQITFKGKTYFLGAYSELTDAVKAREKGEIMYERFLESYYSEHQNKRLPAD